FLRAHRALHSFPPRRSSDLSSRVVVGVPSASASPPRKAISRRVQRAAGECHAAVTLPAGPEVSGSHFRDPQADCPGGVWSARWADRKSTRLNSSHVAISYAV